ncbi:transcription factor ILR3-like isoform X1 [Ananas comosus]|uniref:Transcription factor ILR3 n=1 Tax=Ananas comosus TaxID=4615 RepID=A0A199VCX1_ANACO|nr:transcription factor ILR3-like isoform X1 [Ananas comosus]OAY74944.1 Transcription factor ILR3 [Ananas comosus]
MGSPENPNWYLDCALIDELPVADGGLCWSAQGFNSSSNVSLETDGPCVNSGGSNESGSRKRIRSESCRRPASKACREKMRRDKLNERFLELGSVLDPGKPLKVNKEAILSDATRMVIQLRDDAQKLKDSNESLQAKIEELKAEKNELRDEKQRLKAEKDGLEQQIKILNSRPSFIPQPPLIPTAFAARNHSEGQKLVMPIIGYPGFPMWQFMPPSDVDTSQDTENCSPVA